MQLSIKPWTIFSFIWLLSDRMSLDVTCRSQHPPSPFINLLAHVFFNFSDFFFSLIDSHSAGCLLGVTHRSPRPSLPASSLPFYIMTWGRSPISHTLASAFYSPALLIQAWSTTTLLHTSLLIWEQIISFYTTPFKKVPLSFFLFYWSIVDTHCYISYRCTA